MSRNHRAVATTLGALVLLVVASLAAGAGALDYASDPAHEPCPALTPGDHQVAVDTPDGERIVLLHAPRDAYRPLPLVIALHGAGEQGPDFAVDTGFSRLADREHFLVAYPSAIGPASFWDISGTASTGPGEVQELKDSLDALEGEACVNPARVFVTGVSNGGGMTARLACELSDRLAGAAPVAGGYRALPPCHPARRLPVLEIHGTGDQVVPYGGLPPDYGGSVQRWLGLWRQIDGCAGKADRVEPAVGVHEMVWRHCAAGTSVGHVRLDHQAHGWPGGPRTVANTAAFSTTWRTWEFFRALPGRPPVVETALQRRRAS
jgi:polyhydroxybutyrate depolymerase